jgi:ATP-binding cassette subfamily C protein CydC
MKELLQMLQAGGSRWRWITAGLFLAVAVIAANAFLMALSGWFIASMAVAGASGASFNYFIPSAAIRALAIFRAVGRYIERLVTHETAFRILADLRVWLFRRLIPLAPAGLEHYAGGDVAGRLRADIDALESLYLRIAAPLATGLAAMVLATIFVALWNIPAALSLMFFLLAAGLLLPLLARRLATEPGVRTTELAGKLRTAVTEGLQGAEELILLGAAQRQAERVAELSQRLVAEQERLGQINGLVLAGTVACAGFGLASVLLSGAAATVSGELSGPALVVLLLFSASAFEAAGQMPTALQLLPGAKEAIRRIRSLADAAAPVPEPATPAPLPVGTGLLFQNVTCAYDPSRPVLTGFNLELQAGEHVGLTGPSGSGKSTVVEILLRFRSYAGSVTIGGTELADMSGDDIHQLVAALPQRSHLFNSSLRENLLLGNPDAGADEIAAALADAGLADWVNTLPQGLETPLGEVGSAVSGGEGRRIALARALLMNAPILILDEPTEGLDANAEQLIVARLKERLAGKTVLLITHRPLCLLLADRIVRMP